jgi:tRNA G26 N,N-dimethylase Trm1
LINQQYIEAMIEIEDSKCDSRQQADEILKKVEPELSIRQFLLTNLHRPASADHWTFRIPVKMIKKNLADIGEFPFDDEKGLQSDARDTSKWEGKTMFIKGAKSK